MRRDRGTNKNYLRQQYRETATAAISHNYLSQQFADYEKIFRKFVPLVRRGDYTLGRTVEAFEANIRALTGAKYAIGVGSGTDALVLGIKALDIGPGDEVITTPYTFAATVGAIVATGARPIFVDIKDDYTIDPEKIDGAITKHTKAILPVHWSGLCCDMRSILRIAKRRKLHIIEDACHAINGLYHGKAPGTFGDVGCFSLHPLKNLNVWGDGGFIVTDGTGIRDRIILWRNHGFISRDVCLQYGVNSRLDSIQAIVANHLLKKLDHITNARIRNAAFFDRALISIPQITIPDRDLGIKQVFHLYIIRAEKRGALQRYLRRHGIDAKVHYPIPMHLHPASKQWGYKKGDFPVAEEVCASVLSLPVHEFLRKTQLEYVVERVKAFYAKERGSVGGRENTSRRREINLMRKYPKTKRAIHARGREKTASDQRIARKFGKAFFDGDRRYGYGGFSYDPKYWTGVVADMIQYYRLTPQSKILDIGCAKGFMLHDFRKALPGVTVRGIDISHYAIRNAMEDMKPFLSVGNAKDLTRFKDKEFDLVVSINTIHNLPLEECKQALREIQRVGKHAFIVNDAWRNEKEKKRLHAWNLTGVTVMHVRDWKKLFAAVGYTGDYYWFIA